MEVLAAQNDWIATDSDNLARFLETDTGKRLIPKLVEHAPRLLASGESNAILIRSGEVRAWTHLAETLLDLAHPAPPAPPQVTEYPALTDDKAWADGQKIEQAPTTENPIT